MTDPTTTTPTEMEDVACVDCGAPGVREVPTGRFSDFIRRIGWYCHDCAARRETEAEQRRLEEHAERERLDRQDREWHRDQFSNVPRALRRDLADLHRDVHNDQALTAAAAWARGELAGLMLTGPVGTGKSSIAAAAAWERYLIAKCSYTSVPVLLAKALAQFDSQERAEALADLTGKRSLVLDDLDKMRASEFAAAQLFAAIDNRVSEGAGLLVTTNLTPDGIASRIGGEFGEAIASRLVGYCRVIRVDGPDRRLR